MHIKLIEIKVRWGAVHDGAMHRLAVVGESEADEGASKKVKSVGRLGSGGQCNSNEVGIGFIASPQNPVGNFLAQGRRGLRMENEL